MNDHSDAPQSLLSEMDSLRARLAEQERRLAELGRVEQALRESESKYRALVETTDTAYVIIDEHGQVLDANRQYARLSGHETVPEILGRGVLEWTAPHDIARSREEIGRCLGLGSVRGLEVDYIGPAGQITPIEINATVIRSADGPPRILSLCRDVMQRQGPRRAEESVHHGEERYRQLVDLCPDAIFVTQKGRVIYVNPAALQLFGTTDAKQILGLAPFDFIHPDCHAPARDRISHIREHSETVPFVEEKYIRLDGTVVDVEVAAAPYRDEHGTGIQVIARDISDRKRTEERLRKSEQRLELALRGTELGLWDWNVQTGEAFFDQRWVDILGYSLEEMEPHISFWEKHIHPDDLPLVNATVLAHFEGRTAHYETEHRVRTKSGEWRWIHDKGKIVERDAQGRPLREAGTSLDITARKRAEEALRASEAKFGRFFQSNPLPSIIASFPQGQALEVNEAFLHKTGFTREEIIGRTSAELGLWADGVQDSRLFDALQAGQTPYTFEGRCRMKSGERRDIVATFDFIEFSGTRCYVGMYYDITDRKRAQEEILRLNEQLEQRVIERTAELHATNEALRVAEARQRALLEAMPDMMFRLHRDGVYLDFSAPRGNTWVPPDRIIGRNIRDMPFPPEVIEASQTAFERVLDGGGIETFEYSLPVPGRGSRDYEARVVRSGADEVVATVRDITERKRMESALRVNEASLAAAQRIAHLGSWEMDLIDTENLHANPLRWSDEAFRIFGHEPGTVTVSYKNLLQAVHPDDRAAIQHIFTQSIRDGTHYSVEHRIIRPDGTVRIVYKRTDVLFDRHTGRAVKLMGIVHDITERRQAEDEIRKLNEELEERVRQRTAELEAANRELESFSYSVSHDLIAPLRGIDGWSLALVEDYDERLDDRGREYLHNVRFEAQRMALLIDDMLRLSRVTRSDMRRQGVDLSSVAMSIAEDLRRREPQRQVEFAIQPQLMTRGDPTLLRVVLQNLLENAWKFTGRHAAARIELGVLLENGVKIYYVRDDGAGFDMTYADKLFVPFRRLHRTEEFPGSGVGLATVQRIIQRHGGRIWAESALEQGATFKFTLLEKP